GQSPESPALGYLLPGQYRAAHDHSGRVNHQRWEATTMPLTLPPSYWRLGSSLRLASFPEADRGQAGRSPWQPPERDPETPQGAGSAGSQPLVVFCRPPPWIVKPQPARLRDAGRWVSCRRQRWDQPHETDDAVECCVLPRGSPALLLDCW